MWFFNQCHCSAVKSCPTLCNHMNCSTPGFSVHHHLPEFAQSHLYWINDAILPAPSPLDLNFSQHQGLFQWVSTSHQVAKILKHQLQRQSFQWIFRTDFFRTDWFDVLTAKGLSRVFSSTTVQKYQILQHSAFVMVQLSHPYMPTGKTIALTIWIFVVKVMSLLFNTLSRFVIAILPTSKCLLISWLQSPFALILEPNKMKWILFPYFPQLFSMLLLLLSHFSRVRICATP